MERKSKEACLKVKQSTDFYKVEFQAVIIAIPRNFPQDIDKDRYNSENCGKSVHCLDVLSGSTA